MTATLYAGLNRLPDVAPTPFSLNDSFEPQAPEWWLNVLTKRLEERNKTLKRFDDYYAGNQPLQFATKKFRQAFGDLFGEFCSNYCALVVDAVAERLVVQGFRMGGDVEDDPNPDPDNDGDLDLGPEGADDDAWRIWQANQLDLQSRMGHVEALIKSIAYIHVSPFKADWPAPDSPCITIEDPMQVYVETAPANPRKRLAALKRWLDEDGYVYATVYLPGEIYKYRSQDAVKSTQSSGNMRWVQYAPDGEAWPLANPLGEVFFVPLNNRLRVGGQTSSEIAEAVHIQDGINKLLCDMLLTSEFGSFPQKFVTNFTLETDPNTGKPKEPWSIGVDRILIAPPTEEGEGETKFGQFDAADLKQSVGAIEHLIQELASITRTPPHYLLGSMGTFPSGESLRAAETGLVTKARERMLSFGEAWEEALGLAFKALKDPRADVVDSETIWRDPETRTEAEHVDALVKLSVLGVPLQQLWLDAGYSPTVIKRFKRMLAEQATWGIAPNLNPQPVGEPGPAVPGPQPAPATPPGPTTPPAPPAPTR